MAEIEIEDDPLMELLYRLATIRPEDIITPQKFDSAGMDDLGLVGSQKLRRIYSLAPLIELEAEVVAKAADKADDEEIIGVLLDRVDRLQGLHCFAEQYFWAAVSWVIPEIAEYRYLQVTTDWHVVGLPEDLTNSIDEVSELVFVDTKPVQYH